MSYFVPVNEPLLDGNEKAYLAECIDTGWISSEGPFVKRFESDFAARLGRTHAIAVTNGTAALDVAIEALCIGPGDEVIVPTFTIISCVLQIIRAGAVPVLVDCNPITWNLDVSQIEAKITNRTKAIMAVHIYGLPVDMDPIIELCKCYGLKLIEDAAEAIGQTYYGKPCGSFGDISTVSFYPNKHVTTGEGGMIFTNDPELAEKCRDLRNLCFKSGQRFVHERMGWNLRMTNLQAALGVAQLERLDKFIIKKRLIGQRYSQLLGSIEGLQLPLLRTEYATNLFWVYALVLNDTIDLSVTQVMDQLYDLGVGTRPFFYPMHNQPVFRRMGLFQSATFPVSERLYQRGFYLPSGLALTDDQILHVVNALQQVLGNV